VGEAIAAYLEDGRPESAQPESGALVPVGPSGNRVGVYRYQKNERSPRIRMLANGLISFLACKFAAAACAI
jgi:hypothetical protein